MTSNRLTHRNLKNKRIVLIGGHELGCLCLEHLIQNQYRNILCLGRGDDKGKDDFFPSLLKLARRYRVPSIPFAKINDSKILKTIKKMDADIVLSLHNNQIFQKPWFDFFDERLGIVNAHHGPLPRYGGYWPEMWAIWNQEKNFGVTLHYVDEGVDTGSIIAQRRVAISSFDTRKTLYDKCTLATFQLFKQNLDILLTDKIHGKKQDASKRSYYKRVLPNNGFVDFRWNSQKILRFFRAVSFRPFVGPKIRIGKRVISSLEENLSFFKPVSAKQSDYRPR